MLKRLALKGFAIIGVFALGLVSYGLVAKEKVVSTQAVKKAEQLAQSWKKSYRYDSKIAENIREQIDFISDIQAMLNRPELETALKVQIEKQRSEALSRLASLEDKAVPYLVYDYIVTVRDRFRPKDMLSSEMRRDSQAKLNTRSGVLEIAIQAVGIKAIPALSDLNSRAASSDTGLLVNRSKALINEIVRASHLEVEKAKVQLEIKKEPELKNASASVPAPELPPQPMSVEASEPSENTSK